MDEDFLLDQEFYISDIDDSIFERIKGKSFKENCPIEKSDLKYLHLMHKTLDGTSEHGELICNKLIADNLLKIFKELYKASYPIEKIRLVDDYDADDEKSMAANNSSCFNFRFISFTTIVSKHGAGLAIDINPLYNPYIKTVNGALDIEPANAEPHEAVLQHAHDRAVRAAGAGHRRVWLRRAGVDPGGAVSLGGDTGTANRGGQAGLRNQRK